LLHLQQISSKTSRFGCNDDRRSGPAECPP
jgi:hypothetical protein